MFPLPEVIVSFVRFLSGVQGSWQALGAPSLMPWLTVTVVRPVPSHLPLTEPCGEVLSVTYLFIGSELNLYFGERNKGQKSVSHLKLDFPGKLCSGEGELGFRMRKRRC